MRDPNISIVQSDADAGHVIAKAYAAMREKVWNSYLSAIHNEFGGRELDRLDLLFSFDHGGADQYDSKYTIEYRAKYHADTRALAAIELRRVYPNWIDPTGNPDGDPNSHLSGRQQQVLAAIRTHGGDWTPRRVTSYLRTIGVGVTDARSLTVLKALAKMDYLEPIRPRAYTHRLKEDA